MRGITVETMKLKDFLEHGEQNPSQAEAGGERRAVIINAEEVAAETSRQSSRILAGCRRSSSPDPTNPQ